MTRTEQLVLDAEQLAPLHVEVPATHQTQRFTAGRAVERLGDRRPPVDHHGVGMLVGHGEAPDVEALDARTVVGPVDAAEDERGIAQIELREPVEDGLVEHIALVAGLEGATERALVETTELPGVDLALLEAAVGEVDELLLSGKIRVMLRHEEKGHAAGRAPKTWSRNSIGVAGTHNCTTRYGILDRCGSGRSSRRW